MLKIVHTVDASCYMELMYQDGVSKSSLSFPSPSTYMLLVSRFSRSSVLLSANNGRLSLSCAAVVGKLLAEVPDDPTLAGCGTLISSDSSAHD